MRISVVMVVKNGEDYLPEAIESVLKQTVQPNEIIVVDGHSTDGTPQIARSYTPVTFIKQSGSGLANARNCGIDHAKGELVAFLDSDDIWVRDKLEIQAELFSNRPEIQYVYSRLKLFLENGHHLRNGYNLKMIENELKGRTPGTLMVKKSLFEKIGKFDPRYTIACDLEWFSRAADYDIPYVFVSQSLLLKRLHKSNLSGDIDTNRREVFNVLRESIERKKEIQKPDEND